MDFTQLYEPFKALENPSFWQDAYMKFYMAWFYEDRWTMYVDGLITTVQVTIMALIIGVILGCLLYTSLLSVLCLACIRSGLFLCRKPVWAAWAGYRRLLQTLSLIHI